MGDLLIMSTKERKRKVILEDVQRGILRLKDASSKLGVCYRQAKRLLARYRAAGDAGLVHKSRGKTSGRAATAEFKQKVFEIYEQRYMGFGPTFTAEKMREADEIKVHPETLRRWLLQKNLWLRSRKRQAYRQRRQRREKFGEMVQIDGSEHAWFGAEQPRCCLLNMVDDATSTTLSEMDTGETCRVLLSVFKKWVEKYGVPQSVYVDLKNVYVSPKRIIDDDVESTMNVFERICNLLDVKIIKAYSPQAKGRVERNHGIYQDRFVKELKLKGIKTIPEANKFLEEIYHGAINKKFSKQATSLEEGHCSAKAYGDLEQIFCWEYKRQIRNDYTIRFNNEFFQLVKDQRIRIRPKQNVYVRVHLDNSVSVWLNDACLKYEKIEIPTKEAKVKREMSPSLRSENSRKNKSRTPWSRPSAGWLKSKSSRKGISRV